MKIPFVTALYNSDTYKKWKNQYSLNTSFEDEVGTGELTCVIKITPRPPWTSNEVRGEIHDQTPVLVEELKARDFDVQMLGRARCVGTGVYVRLY